MTIVESIKCVLQNNHSGLTSKQIYDEIIRRGLYIFGAENPVGVVNAQLRRRCAGLDFPTAYPVKFFEIAGYEGKKIKFRLLSEEKEMAAITTPKIPDSSELLPEEKIKSALQEHFRNMRQQVFNCVLNNSPQFFEHLVIDLLLEMGYGKDKNSGVVTGRSHDGGIDGIISEDKLGLDLIYIQAKKYSPTNKVGRKEIQDTSDLKDMVEKYPVEYRDCKAQIAGLLVASETRRRGIDMQSPKLEQVMLQYLSNNDTLLSEDGIKTLNAYALKGYRLITDYPLFDKPTSREEFLDAFNAAIQFYEKKDA